VSLTVAEQSLRDGDLQAALRNLQNQVRKDPADAKLRVFLFQLLAVLGDWERALTQLNVAADLDAGALAMAQMYRQALHCERLRTEVFAGRKSPLIFGEPEEWLALLIESLLAASRSSGSESAALRARAFEAAPGSSGSLDGEQFEWIADADMRIGPVCEAIINGRYYWIPFSRMAKIDLEAPADLRDLVWTPAHFEFVNGGETVGLIPTRYAGSEASADPQITLSKKTVWNETAPEVFVGLGQRVLTTNAGEYALMDVRAIVFDDHSGDEAAGSANA
jgi:type VI secretion system protein ImpE